MFPVRDPKVVRMVSEKVQWEIAVNLDIPQHAQHSEAVTLLLESIAQTIARAIESNDNLQSRMKALKIDYAGVNVESC